MKRIALLIFVAGLAGCDMPSFITSGTIISKRHEDATTTTQLLPIFAGGKTHWMMMPVQQPEKWFVEIKGWGTDEKEYTREFRVDSIEWAALKIGDRWEKP